MKTRGKCICAWFLAIFIFSCLHEMAEARVLDLLTSGEKIREQNSGDTVFLDLVKVLPKVLDRTVDDLDTVVDTTLETVEQTIVTTMVETGHVTDEIKSLIDSEEDLLLHKSLLSEDGLANSVESVRNLTDTTLNAVVLTVDTVTDGSGKIVTMTESTLKSTLKSTIEAVASDVQLLPLNVSDAVRVEVRVVDRSPYTPHAAEIEEPPLMSEVEVGVVEQTHDTSNAVEIQNPPLAPEVTYGLDLQSSADPSLTDSVPEDWDHGLAIIPVLSEKAEHQNTDHRAFDSKLDKDAVQTISSDMVAERLNTDKPLTDQKRETPSYPLAIAAAASAIQPVPNQSGSGDRSSHQLNNMDYIQVDDITLQLGNRRIYARNTKLLIPNRANEPPTQPPQHTLFSQLML